MDRREAMRLLQPHVNRARNFTGWSFPKDSWRRLGPPLTWDYELLVREAAQSANSVLDMGTGGEEFLAGISSSLPERTVATEEWPVNVLLRRGT